MAEFNITVENNTIHAEFLNGNRTMISNSSIKLDPLTLSYSTLGTLCKYNIEITNIIGLTEPIILLNGKNSRFSANNTGSCNLVLTVEDDMGNTDEETIIITVI